MSGELLTKDLITYDPLTETTRKERTALLGLSMLGIALVKIPLVPEKLAFLGIEFVAVQQENFVKLYALVIIYYLVAFCIYAFTDYVAWRRKEVIVLMEYDEQIKARKLSGKIDLTLSAAPPESAAPGERSIRYSALHGDLRYVGFASYWLAFWAARARAAFEFFLPIIFSAWVIFNLLSYKQL